MQGGLEENIPRVRARDADAPLLLCAVHIPPGRSVVRAIPRNDHRDAELLRLLDAHIHTARSNVQPQTTIAVHDGRRVRLLDDGELRRRLEDSRKNPLDVDRLQTPNPMAVDPALVGVNEDIRGNLRLVLRDAGGDEDVVHELLEVVELDPREVDGGDLGSRLLGRRGGGEGVPVRQQLLQDGCVLRGGVLQRGGDCLDARFEVRHGARRFAWHGSKVCRRWIDDRSRSPRCGSKDRVRAVKWTGLECKSLKEICEIFDFANSRSLHFDSPITEISCRSGRYDFSYLHRSEYILRYRAEAARF